MSNEESRRIQQRSSGDQHKYEQPYDKAWFNHYARVHQVQRETQLAVLTTVNKPRTMESTARNRECFRLHLGNLRLPDPYQITWSVAPRAQCRKTFHFEYIGVWTTRSTVKADQKSQLTRTKRTLTFCDRSAIGHFLSVNYRLRMQGDKSK